MKKLLFLFIICFFVQISTHAQKQCPVEISLNSIDISGQTKNLSNKISDALTEGLLKSIILYEDNKYEYGVEFQYYRSANRLKLMHREFARIKGDKTIYRKWTKQVQFVKVAIQGEFTGSCGGNITVNKKNLDYLFLNANYKIAYK